MIRLLMTVVLIFLGGLRGPIAVAGVYADDLSKCLVKSSSENDQLVLVTWIFSALSLHPALQSFLSITADQRADFNKKGAELFARLLTEDCLKETVDAVKYEGGEALGASFQVLGQVATRDLMTDPQVAKGLSVLGTYVANDQKLKDLLKAVGTPEQNPSTGAPAK